MWSCDCFLQIARINSRMVPWHMGCLGEPKQAVIAQHCSILTHPSSTKVSAEDNLCFRISVFGGKKRCSKEYQAQIGGCWASSVWHRNYRHFNISFSKPLTWVEKSQGNAPIAWVNQKTTWEHCSSHFSFQGRAGEKKNTPDINCAV